LSEGISTQVRTHSQSRLTKQTQILFVVQKIKGVSFSLYEAASEENGMHVERNEVIKM